MKKKRKNKQTNRKQTKTKTNKGGRSYSERVRAK